MYIWRLKITGEFITLTQIKAIDKHNTPKSHI